MGVHAQHKHHLFSLSSDDSNVTSQMNNVLSQLCMLSWCLADGFAHALPGLHSVGEFSVKYFLPFWCIAHGLKNVYDCA